MMVGDPEYDARGLPTKPLRLVKLPHLMMKKTMDYMTSGERVRLATLSDRMEKRVKAYTNKTIFNYHLKIDDVSTGIKFDHENNVLVGVSDNVPVGNDNEDIIFKRDIEKWCDKKKSDVENTVIVLSKLKELLSKFEAPLKMDLNVDESRILEIITLPDFKNLRSLYLHNFRLSFQTIDKVMEWSATKDRLVMKNLKFPLDFHSEHAFKCPTVWYDDAGWVQAEHLLTLRHNASILLDESSIEGSELNWVLRFWLNADYDMFRELDIYMGYQNSFYDIFEKIGELELVGFKQIENWFLHDEGRKYYMILSKSMSESKLLKIGIIQIRPYSFHMKTELISELEEFVEILQLVGKKKEKDAARKVLKMQAFQEDRAADEFEGYRALTEEANELARRLGELNVQFEDKKPRLVKEQPIQEQPIQE